MADWSPLSGRAAITVFDDHLSDSEAVVEPPLSFHVVCVMRERTPLPRSVIERLPQLKLIASTGPRNASIDVEAATEQGIVVAHTGYDAPRGRRGHRPRSGRGHQLPHVGPRLGRGTARAKEIAIRLAVGPRAAR
jgi:hypothetical protein